METEVYDVAVIGAGFIGSSAAYHLTKAGKRIVLLDQFGVPSNNGCCSSRGQRRCVMNLVAPPIIPLLHYSTQFFYDLEVSSGEKLVYKTGSIIVGKSSSDTLPAMKQLADNFNIPHEMLTGPEMSRKIQGTVFDEEFRGIYEDTSSMIRSDKVLRLVQEGFRQSGGVIKDTHRVTAVTPPAEQGVITIHTSDGVVRAEHVVVAAGPWSQTLLKTLGVDVPLEVLALSSIGYKEKTLNQYGAKTGCPFLIFLDSNSLGQHPACKHSYFNPSLECPGTASLSVTQDLLVDPENAADLQGHAPSEGILAISTDLISKHFPGLQPRPSIISVDVCTFTPDQVFVIDRHPQFENIVFAAGLSGYGFMTSPCVGKVLCELVQNHPPSVDLTPFRLSRFEK